MVELLIPIGVNLPVVMNPASIPLSLQGQISGVIRNEHDAREIGATFGRSHKPKKPILLVGPDERTVILIVGDGAAEAAELEDIALAKLDQQRSRVRKTGRGLDFDAMRDRHNLMRREDVDPAIRQALVDRIKAHQSNSRTDPSRIPGR